MGKDFPVPSEAGYRKKVGSGSNNTSVTGKGSNPKVKGQVDH